LWLFDYSNKQRRGFEYAAHIYAAAIDFKSESSPQTISLSTSFLSTCSSFTLPCSFWNKVIQLRSHFLCDYTPFFSAISHVFS
jgi:hypothetical protein